MQDPGFRIQVKKKMMKKRNAKCGTGFVCNVLCMVGGWLNKNYLAADLRG